MPVPIRSKVSYACPCPVPPYQSPCPARSLLRVSCPRPLAGSRAVRVRPNPCPSHSGPSVRIRPNPCPSHSGPSVRIRVRFIPAQPFAGSGQKAPPPPPFPPGHGGRIPVRGQVLPWSVREAQDTPQETYPRPARPALVPYVPLPTCALAYPFLAFTRPLRLPPSPLPSFPWRRSNGIQGFDGMSGPGAGGAAADRISRQRYAAAGRFGHGCCQPAIMIGSEGAACIAVD